LRTLLLLLSVVLLKPLLLVQVEGGEDGGVGGVEFWHVKALSLAQNQAGAQWRAEEALSQHSLGR
jgi:hypothetical protein